MQPKLSQILSPNELKELLKLTGKKGPEVDEEVGIGEAYE